MEYNPFAALASTLGEYLAAYTTVHRSNSAEFVSGSPAASDVAVLGGATSWAGDAMHHGTVMMALGGLAAVDHLRALQHLLSPPDTVYAPPVIARASLEASAGVWHLADPGIAAHERLRRCLNDRLLGLHESRQLRLRLEPGEVEGIDREVADITAHTSELGWQVRKPKRDHDSPYLMEKRPSNTALCTSILSRSHLGITAYRMLSGVAHARHHGLLSALSPVNDEEASESTVTFEINSATLALRLLPGPLAAVLMTRRLWQYLGWDSGQITPTMSKMLGVWGSVAQLPSTPTMKSDW